MGWTRSGIALLLSLAGAAACGGSAPPPRGDESTPVQIQLAPHADTTDGATLEVVGLPADVLSALRDAALSADEWTAWLRVSVAERHEDIWKRPAVLGTYSVGPATIRFTTPFSLDPGRPYRVALDPARLPARLTGVLGARGAVEVTVRAPAPDHHPTTTVTAVYPTSAVVPENLLRLYVRFSAPMGLGGGIAHVQLVNEDGQVVEDPFLPLDVALWNGDRTRFTLLFDPGRVKRGILPNQRMGPPLAEGTTYRLVIDRDWRDARGLPLAESFSRSFTVGPPEHRAIQPTGWRVSSPVAGSRHPVVVAFPRPLDYALLQRALQVTLEQGVVEGRPQVGVGETRWSFTPREPWETREYRVVVRPVLEDPAGNRVGRPFETAASARARAEHPPDGTSLSFRPRPPAP